MKDKERKFLLLNLPKEANKPDVIKTTDLLYEDGRSLTVEVINNKKAYLIYNHIEDKKFRYQIPLHDGISFYANSDNPIEYLRHKLAYAGNIVDINIYNYQDANVFGIVTIEFETELTQDQIPKYCGPEITQ